MSDAPEYQVPYQFAYAEQDDTYHMVIDLYLGDVLQRLVKGHTLTEVIAADILRSQEWKKKIDKQRKEAQKRWTQTGDGGETAPPGTPLSSPDGRSSTPSGEDAVTGM